MYRGCPIDNLVAWACFWGHPVGTHDFVGIVLKQVVIARSPTPSKEWSWREIERCNACMARGEVNGLVGGLCGRTWLSAAGGNIKETPATKRCYRYSTNSIDLCRIRLRCVTLKTQIWIKTHCCKLFSFAYEKYRPIPKSLSLCSKLFNCLVTDLCRLQEENEHFKLSFFILGISGNIVCKRSLTL